MFSLTNILTRCPVPVSVCELQKRSKNESARNGLKIYEDFLSTGRLQKPEGGQEGSQGATPLLAPGAHLGTLATASYRLFAYKIPKTLKTEAPGGFFQKRVRPPPSSKTLIRGTEVFVMALCRNGEVPPEPSSSTLLPPTMMRE